MKKLINRLAVSGSIILLFSCGGDSKKTSGIELKGKLSNASGETLILEQMSSQGYVFIDSTKVDEEGNFAFENANIKQMDFYRIKISEANFAVLVTDSTQKISLKGDAKSLGNSYQVEGSADTKQFIELNKLLQGTNSSFDSLKNAMNEALYSLKMDSTKMDSLNDVYEAAFMSIYDKISPKVIEKVESFPATIANFSAFNMINIEKNLATYEKIHKALSEKLPQSFYTQNLGQDIAKYKEQFEVAETQNKLLPDGGEMPDFKLSTPEGKELSVSSFKGKVLLIDFWASWCGPCRKENPNVVRLYNTYNKKGFEILGVSLDEDKEKWVNAIAKDGLKWKHVSDLKGWNSIVCGKFNISSIPYTILVGKDGKIIGKGLRGAKLEDQLAKLF